MLELDIFENELKKVIKHFTNCIHTWGKTVYKRLLAKITYLINLFFPYLFAG